MSGGFRGHKHSAESRRKISEASDRPENVEKLQRAQARWREQNPDEAREVFRRAGFKTSHRPGHVEWTIANNKKWAAENPEAAHRRNVRAGFSLAHFTRLCHEKKANPCCPFCYPDGTEAKV